MVPSDYYLILIYCSSLEITLISMDLHKLCSGSLYSHLALSATEQPSLCIVTASTDPIDSR